MKKIREILAFTTALLLSSNSTLTFAVSEEMYKGLSDSSENQIDDLNNETETSEEKNNKLTQEDAVQKTDEPIKETESIEKGEDDSAVKILRRADDFEESNKVIVSINANNKTLVSVGTDPESFSKVIETEAELTESKIKVKYYIKNSDDEKLYFVEREFIIPDFKIKEEKSEISFGQNQMYIEDSTIYVKEGKAKVKIALSYDSEFEISEPAVKLINKVQGSDESKEIKASFDKKENDLYYYNAEFEIEDDGVHSFDLLVNSVCKLNEIDNLKFENNASKVVIDNTPPEIGKSGIHISYINENRYFEEMKQTSGFFLIEGTVCDTESGIAKIEYRIDPEEHDEKNIENDFTEYLEPYFIAGQKNKETMINHANRNKNHSELYYESEYCEKYTNEDYEKYKGGKTEEFQIIVPYLSTICNGNSEGLHKVQFQFTDKSGNCKNIPAEVYTDENSGGVDIVAPEYTDIKICEYDDLSFNSLNHGNYTNISFDIDAKVKDISNTEYISGIKNIIIYDDRKEIYNIKQSNFANFPLEINKKYTDLQIEVSDNGEQKNKKSLKDLLKTFKSSNEAYEDVIEKMTSNTFVIENSAPEYKVFDHSNNEITDKETIWLNKNEKTKLTVNINDKIYNDSKEDIYSGIGEIKISGQVGKSGDLVKYPIIKADSKASSDISEKSYSVNYSETDSRISSQDIVFNSGDMSDGKYSYTFNASDNASNSMEEKTLNFGVDKVEPGCEMSYSKGLYENKWFREDEKLELQFKINDAVSGIDENTVKASVSFKTKGQNKSVKISSDNIKISEDKNDCTVGISSADFYDGENIPDDLTYSIKIEAYDIAGNPMTYTKEISCDNWAPVFNEINAKSEKPHYRNSILYSNRDTDILIDVSDNVNFENQSGISEVSYFEVDFDPYGDNSVDTKSAEYIPLKENNGKYTLSLHLDKSGSYSKILCFKVTDKVGHETCRLCELKIEDKTYKIQKIESDPVDSEHLRIVMESIPSEIFINGKESRIRPEKGSEDELTADSVLSKFVSEEHKNDLEAENSKFAPVYTNGDKKWFNLFDDKYISFDIFDIHSGIQNIKVYDLYDKESILDDDKYFEKLTEDKMLFEVSYDENDPASEADDKRVFSKNYKLKDSALKDGRHEFAAVVTDNSGNESAGAYNFYIDSISPEIEGFSFVAADEENAETVKTLKPEETAEGSEERKLSYRYFAKSDSKITVNTKDSGASSGLQKLEYALIPNTNEADETVNYSETSSETDGRYKIAVQKGFKGYLTAKVSDNVNNESEFKNTEGIVIEDTAPDTEYIFSSEASKKDASQNEMYTEDVEVTVNVTDKESGIKKIVCTVISEKHPDGIVTEISTNDLKDGWSCTETDENLVTAVSKTFRFDADDNDIKIIIESEDNCLNSGVKESKVFTIDKTAPVIEISKTEGYNGTDFYNSTNRAVIDIKVTERNFDEALIRTEIENSFNSNIPAVSFSDDPTDRQIHKATLTFPEGDFVFSVQGTDLAGHEAEIKAPYEGKFRFSVDETSPVVTTNFDKFSKGNGNYFNTDKEAVISVRDHNFDPYNSGLVIYKKGAGSEHTEADLYDASYSYVKPSDWKQSAGDRDLYELKFPIKDESVFKIGIMTYDKAGNAPSFGNSLSETEIFEIDKTAPEVVRKNGESVKDTDVEFLDIYDENRKDASAPTVEFDDTNFEKLNVTLTKYDPKYQNGKELGKIEETVTNEEVRSKIYELAGFDTDGVYSVNITAEDKAGNISKLNKNTYVRMMDTEVLAYLPDSSIEEKSGLYSFEYKNGKPVSKRPDDFDDINIVVMSKKGEKPQIVLRDTNGEEKNTNIDPKENTKGESDIYGVEVLEYTLPGSFFTENYQNDVDKELYLTVKTDDGRTDLGRIHIDSIAPEASVPDELKSWHWYPGKETREVVISSISEVLEGENCRVYDNNREIPFEYSEETKTLKFSLSEGWHNIGIHLEDVAGNAYDIQEAENICVGNFWIWIMAGGAAAIGAAAGAVLIMKKRKKKKEKILEGF